MDFSISNKPSHTIIAIVYSLLGFLYIATLANLQPLGVSPDSVSYLTIASNFSNGLGFTSDIGTIKLVHVTHWPPFFSMVLGFFSLLFNHNTLQAAIYLNAILLAASVFVSNSILLQYTDRKKLLHIFNIFLITGLSSIYLMVWSETLFIFIVLCIAHCILRYLDTDKKIYLLYTSILLGLSIVTRYVGLGVAGTIFLFFLLTGRKRRFLDTLLILLYLNIGMILIIGTWFVYIVQHKAPSEVRPIQFHFITLEHIQFFLYTVVKWVFPLFQARYGLIIVILAFVLFALSYPYKHILRTDKTLFLLLIGAGYIGFVVFSILFFDHITPLDPRILSPVFPVFLLSFFAVISQNEVNNTRIYIQHALKATSILLIASQVTYLSISSVAFYQEGLEYTSKAWQASPTNRAVRDYYMSKTVYTNGSDVLKFATGKSSHYLPPKLDPVSTIPKADYPLQSKALIKSLGQDTIIVYFNELGWRNYLTDTLELNADTLRSRKVIFEDGFILQ
jgi:hypothetical protein